MSVPAVVDLGLSRLEETRLATLESVIDLGRQTFIDVGNALLEIRESRLYRDSHGTFEDYCRGRWEMSVSRAYQLVDAARVSTIVEIPNEGQARELAPLLDSPAMLRDAWREANANGTPTAATVREAVQGRMGVHYSSETDLWSTPQDLFDLLDAEFRFDVDVCATAENAKCDRFFTLEDDGLAQDWQGVCWMNPPYGDGIREWVAKAHRSAEVGATVVCLVPARVDTGWWWDHCRLGEIRFLRGRLRFGGGDTGAPFPSAVVVFPRSPQVVWWER